MKYKGFCDNCSSGGWDTDGFTVDGGWKLAPNEKAYVVDTRNRYVYFHAQSSDGEYTWGRSFCETFKNEWICFTEAETGSSYTNYTYGQWSGALAWMAN